VNGSCADIELKQVLNLFSNSSKNFPFPPPPVQEQPPMCLTATERERRFQELKIRRQDKIIGEILFSAGHGHQGRKKSQDSRFPVADGCLCNM
jgi:hypothetical protein